MEKLLAIFIIYLISPSHSDEFMNKELSPDSNIVETRPDWCPQLCNETECYQRQPNENDRTLCCRGGVVVEECGCCVVCAKVEGDRCGGKDNFLGTCDEELVCDPLPVEDLTIVGGKWTGIGICKKADQTAENINAELPCIDEKMPPDSCPKCEDLTCYKNSAERLKKLRKSCPGGITLGPCGCCTQCAKQEGQRCGGLHSYLGTCDRGHICELLPPDQIDGAWDFRAGICKRVCKPTCDPDFCSRHPDSVCAATENSEIARECRGECQHTSCRACQSVQLDILCPECEAHDFNCIRKFGNCFKGKKKSENGEFLCAVPDCPLKEF